MRQFQVVSIQVLDEDVFDIPKGTVLATDTAGDLFVYTGPNRSQDKACWPEVENGTVTLFRDYWYLFPASIGSPKMDAILSARKTTFRP